MLIMLVFWILLLIVISMKVKLTITNSISYKAKQKFLIILTVLLLFSTISFYPHSNYAEVIREIRYNYTTDFVNLYDKCINTGQMSESEDIYLKERIKLLAFNPGSSIFDSCKKV